MFSIGTSIVYGSDLVVIGINIAESVEVDVAGVAKRNHLETITR